ncbi:MAG: amidohydrolase [Acidobacteriota bacterium]|nr:amidohydrolase [Acidobacteriota bacterium]
MKSICGFLILLLAVSPVAWRQMTDATQPADVIYYHGKIITMWDAHPVVEAVAIRGNVFLRVGSNEEVLKTAGPKTQKIDLRGQCIVPGLIDSHTHPISAALSEQDDTLPPMNSIAEIQAYLRRRVARVPPDRLILAPKIFAPRLKERRYPTRNELDAVAADRPLMVDNGYASVLNSFLLAKLGINRETPQPSNGKIGKDEHGEPTGLILGAPQLLRELRRSEPDTPADLGWALKKMQQSYNRVGITSTIDRGQRAAGFRAYQDLRRKGELTVRSYVTYSLSGQGTPKQIREEIERIPFATGWGDDWLRVGSLKIVMDGGILTGTAYLREPYGTNTEVYGYKDPDYRGVLSVPRENVFEMAQVTNEVGWQMTAHVTGGGALDVLLDAYEAADRTQSIRGRRFTVTHGNFPNQQAIARAKQLGVVFDCQPAREHLYGDGIKDVFGPERLKDFLPLRSLFDAGVVVAGGSDHMIRFDPRESINPYHPFYGMWMAVMRRTIDGTVLNPEQRITRREALRMWTLNGAYLSFDEKVKGSIEPGKLADMVVITKDYLSCPVDEIKSIEPLLTMVDGKVVYRRAPGT